MTDPLASFRSLYGPDWRWGLANKSTRRQLARLGPDEILRRAHHYCALLNQDDGNSLAAHAEPAIARAVALNGQYEHAVRLKIMTLGGLPLDEISRRSALDFEVITTWQALFFDLVGMDGARDWCSAHIIAPEERAGHGDIALQLKMARSGGPAAARLLLDAAAEAPIDELKQLERRREKLHLLLEKSLSMVPASSGEAMRLIKIYFDYEVNAKRLALAERQFEELCRRRQVEHQRAQAQQLAAERRDQRKQEELQLRRAEKSRREVNRQERQQRKHDLIRARLELLRQARAASARASRAWASNSALAGLRWAVAEQPAVAGENGDAPRPACGEETLPDSGRVLKRADGPTLPADPSFLDRPLDEVLAGQAEGHRVVVAAAAAA